MHLNLPTILDAAIGLIFIFFIFSLFVSGIVELISTFMEQRSKLLRLAIDKVLGTSLTNAFFTHMLTSVKQQRGFWGTLKPVNYLSAESFSTVLIDLLSKSGRQVGPIDETKVATAQTFAAIRQSLQQTALADVNGLIEPLLARSDDFLAFKKALETWYNGYMEQVSGWYKRYAQGIVWLVSTVVVVGMNVDTIYLTNRLFNDNDLRERIVAAAINTAEKGKASYGRDAAFITYLVDNKSTILRDSVSRDSANSAKPTAVTPPNSKTVTGEKTRKVIKDSLTDSERLLMQTAYVQFVQSQIDDFQLPISWKKGNETWGLQPGQKWYIALLGWLMTTAALAFGAPFWFDLLLKLVNIRNTARRPPGNPDPTK